MMPVAVLLVLLLVASVTDVTRHTIYNWTTYPGIAAGVVLNGFGLGLLGSGWAAVEESVLGFCVCGFVMLVCFVFFDIGGGDVKLMAMLGACLGFHLGIEALLWTFVLGAIAGLVILIWELGALRIVANVWRHAALVVRARSWVPLTHDERKPLARGMFLAPSSLAAVCVVAWPRLSNLL